MTKGFTLAQQAEPVLDYCPVRSTDRDCSLLMLRSRAKSAAPITLRFTRFAFTLAEVLITLAIIGVVAAMTIPTLIQNYQEKVTVTKLKKFYSVMSQAYLQASNESGTVDEWAAGKDQGGGAQIVLDELKPYLLLQKDCGRNAGCFPDVVYKQLNGTNFNNFDKSTDYAKAILSDGTIFRLAWDNTIETATIMADTNGFKEPNTLGKDTFCFKLRKEGITPSGTANELTGLITLAVGCNVSAWVIYNENLDYLHCDDLSWNGKHTCK